MGKKISQNVGTGVIQGTYDSKFEAVAEQFAKNFEEHNELGASCAVTIEGETVVDLWGGCAEEGTNRAWEKDTVSIIWSATKGATALCAHMLVSRGLLDLDAPVSKYWPDFAQNSKDRITTRMLLNHQAGLAAIAEPLKDGAFYDWDYMVKAIEHQKPWFTPQSKHGYQGLTFGWLVGEVVKRISGKSLGNFFRDEVAGPLGLDFWIGLPEDTQADIAKMIMAPPPGEGDPIADFFIAMADPESVQTKLFLNAGGYFSPEGFDVPAGYAAEIPAAGGLANGRALAGMYAPLANDGKAKGREFVNADTLARMMTTASASRDDTLLAQIRFSLGFFKSCDNRMDSNPGNQASIILGPSAFGHPGFGGIVGFADPVERMSFGYTMNRMGAGTLLNERGQGLVDAAYKSLGYRSNVSGVWIK